MDSGKGLMSKYEALSPKLETNTMKHNPKFKLEQIKTPNKTELNR